MRGEPCRLAAAAAPAAAAPSAIWSQPMIKAWPSTYVAPYQAISQGRNGRKSVSRNGAAKNRWVWTWCSAAVATPTKRREDMRPGPIGKKEPEPQEIKEELRPAWRRR